MKVGKTIFKNRILAGPLGTNAGNPGAEITQENIDYYGAIARGGAARVVGGGDAVVNVNGGYMGGMGRVKFFMPMTGDFMSSIRTYVNTIHRYNALAFVQFCYEGGPDGNSFITGIKGFGPSAMTFPNGNEIIEMTHQDMENLANDFASCAAKAKELGLDGCLIHAGHGKILDQFRAGDFNHRTDEYGGSIENRARFPLMVLKKVREAVGPDFILEYRTSVEEYEPGGITIDESIEFFKILEREHLVDLFHITSGRHTNARANARVICPGTFGEAPNREFCRKIKAAGIQTPLVIVNSCANPETAADIIASGDADFVNLSRQLNLADPYYPRKLREGNEHLIDGCIRCHGCYDVCGPCSVNPRATFKTYEDTYPQVKAPVSRKVCVVGGGIGGLKAAYTAAERGHQVILFEESERLGGQLVFADKDTIKTDIRRYKNNMIRRVVEHPNIEVRLGVKATPEMVKAEDAYGVIVAVGATPKRPAIPGAERALTVLEAYEKQESLSGKVVMLGSGLTACEVGLHLNNLGLKVDIVGRRERICYHENFNVMPTALYNPVPTFLDWFQERGMGLYNNYDCVEILDGAVRLRQVETGEELLVEADHVVLCAGMEARSDEAYAFSNAAPFFAMAGDCVRPKKIRDAVFTGYWNAMEI
jgi:2,4-dienoyl-CoA reductase-like NADH-dependent reductase (Old Yellow Enzyme family)